MAKEEIVLKAEKRTVTGKKVANLRREGLLPAVVYGHKLEAFPIQMDAHSAALTLGRLTSSSLVILDVDGETHTCIVRDRQKDVIYGTLLHVDFLALSLTEKLRTAVSISLVGEAPVTEDGDYIITQVLNELEIESLPKDLPEVINVDISGLEKAGDEIRVSDLKLGDGVTILTGLDEIVVAVTYAAQEAEEEEEEEELLEGPELVGGEDKEAEAEE